MMKRMKSEPTAPLVIQRQTEDLDRRYGKIGISAVAAALSCRGDTEEQASTAPGDEGKPSILSAA